MVSLEEGTIQEQDALKEEQQDKDSQLSRSLTTLLPASSLIKLHQEVQNE
jgi:hypothetical protein